MLEAVLLVGGQGTRLRPLTLTTPKPMLPVAGIPFLRHQIEKLRHAGVEHIVLATSYRTEVFADYFGDGQKFGVELTYAVEARPLGTGGAIGHASQFLRSQAHMPVVVYNGDVLSGHDLTAQISHHTKTDAAVTLHLVEVADAAAYGCVPTDEDGRVIAFLEKMERPVTTWINAGCYVFTRGVMDTIPPRQVVSVERETFPHLLEQGRLVQSWKDSSYWLDVGTPSALVRASADLVLGVCPSNLVEASPTGALIDPSADISRDARIVGGSSVGANATVDAGAVVDASIVMAEVVIEAGAVVTRSALGTGSRVASNAAIVEAMLADGQSWS